MAIYINGMPKRPDALPTDYVRLSDTKPDGIAGGSFVKLGWRTRDLNMIEADIAGVVAIADNQVTLQPGEWFFRITVPVFWVWQHRARLQQISPTNQTLLAGTSEYSIITTNPSQIIGEVLLTEVTIVEVQHYCKFTRLNDGFGAAAAIGDGIPERYTLFEAWRKRIAS